ncbi:MAG: hypothetical protein ACRDQZ_23285, partial [Mycobacteriales bacterium]
MREPSQPIHRDGLATGTSLGVHDQTFSRDHLESGPPATKSWTPDGSSGLIAIHGAGYEILRACLFGGALTYIPPEAHAVAQAATYRRPQSYLPEPKRRHDEAAPPGVP